MTNLSSIENARPYLTVINDQVKTSSLKVADHFGKRHADVVRAIRKLECSDEFTQRNFAFSQYKDASGKTNAFYEITKDGFVFLAMGFTGSNAAAWKEAYINAFNAMEAELQKAHHPKPTNALPSGLTAEQCDSIKALVKARVEIMPKDQQAKAAITCWSSLKSKFGCTYKEISPEYFTDALSLVARVDLGEYQPALEHQQEIPTALPLRKYHYPLESYNNDPSGKIHNPLRSYTVGYVMSKEMKSPTIDLLNNLELDGHEVSGCRLELTNIYHMIKAQEQYVQQMFNMFGRMQQMHHDSMMRIVIKEVD